MLLTLLLATLSFAGGFGPPSAQFSFDEDWNVIEVTVDWSRWDEQVSRYCEQIENHNDAASWTSSVRNVYEREIDGIQALRVWYKAVAFTMTNGEDPVPDLNDIPRAIWNGRDRDGFSLRMSKANRSVGMMRSREKLLRAQSGKTLTSVELFELREQCAADFAAAAMSWELTQNEMAKAWSVYAPKIETWASFNSSPATFVSK